MADESQKPDEAPKNPPILATPEGDGTPPPATPQDGGSGPTLGSASAPPSDWK